ncbi:M14 family zinc carboxypeptidase [Nocardiopsis sp. JB363]|uniref:M14 family zinc carboxypeptidase n=1 Tax=Nocardiopsis sp. JB363 TaxID=1434837 RepID=UPI00097A34F8|nr:M14 family zinc carboxypeptidase [Nocardiopsis sp. JB363]SIO85831.1 Secreted protein containing N-terminal Zinc-dependent carboxypeptidase related domain [Nocardiopsis sp. JB363]
MHIPPDPRPDRSRTARPVTLAGATAAFVAVSLMAAPAPALAEPRDDANGSERNEIAADAESLTAEPLAAPPSVPGIEADAAYPRRNDLPVPPEDPDDHSVKLGLAPFHDIAPTLNDLQETSDRVSAEIIGESVQGRDLYLVTLTEPETRAESRHQRRMRELIAENPDRAARDHTLIDRYKTPVHVNANIHGNEWEGTDASLRIIEELATAEDERTEELLGSSRLYFTVTANPDGRVAGTRANGAGFDLNRDFVTVSQPESAAIRQVMIDTQPVVMIDQHGYVNGTLIEPTTPPHGQNYEYDLFIKHTYANAIEMEQAVLDLGYSPEDDGVEPPQIPFRDWEDGWDDWPPIFTPMFAPYQGAVAAATIEFPMRVNNADYDLPEEELRRRSAINTDISAATIEATLDYAHDNHEELVGDQIEVFRRGANGEEQIVPPKDWVPGFGPEDVYTTDFPRGYVIPAGEEQRSAPAAARLVDFLVANDVRVQRADEGFELDGIAYPAGSYVVDMHQPKRGMANVLLEDGRDISDDVDAMYDISGWSHGRLWGATVTATESEPPAGTAVAVADPTGRVDGDGDWNLRLDDAADVAALNDLVEAGVEPVHADQGTVWVPSEAADTVAEVSERHGAVFTAADTEPDGPVLGQVRAAVAGAADEVFTLGELGFDVTTVSTSVLNDGFDWSDIDVLYVSSGLVHGDLNEDARAALDTFLERGGVVARGATGARFNDAAGLLDATRDAGRSDANGVVRVDDGNGVLGGTGGYGFVYSPGWFTDLGPDVTVEQSYATESPLVAGHWRPGADGTGGQQDAAGQASVVSGVAEPGAAVVLFGTEPLFRNHPKGLFGQVGQALHWSAAVDGAA